MSDPLSGGLDPRLKVISEEPLNAETSLTHHRGVISPTSLFYHRNHFPFPAHVPRKIAVDGHVAHPFEFSPEQLPTMSSCTLLTTLECAGNGRSGMTPAPEGEPWEYEAVSTAEWTGVPLATILDMAQPHVDVREIVIEGADGGWVPAAGSTLSYVRSLPLEKALDRDVILAYAMNGDDLTREHGAPCRLLVPGWYGMASVKWVARITAVLEPFRGFYQADRYVVPGSSGSMEPLTTMRVRSLIASPSDGVHVRPGKTLIRGTAWSGEAAITRVEVSVDDGARWNEADLASRPEQYAWRRWEYAWNVQETGPASLISRAFDAAGNTQPEQFEWNALGYANNATQRVRVHAG